MINYLTHTLSNGLRIVHKPIESNVSYCGFIVNAGTRDEAPDQYGMAHFVEHMLFKEFPVCIEYHHRMYTNVQLLDSVIFLQPANEPMMYRNQMLLDQHPHLVHRQVDRI